MTKQWVRQIDEKKPKVLARGTAMPLTNTDFEEIEKRTAPRFSKLPAVLEATLYSPAWRGFNFEHEKA